MLGVVDVPQALELCFGSFEVFGGRSIDASHRGGRGRERTFASGRSRVRSQKDVSCQIEERKESQYVALHC